MKKTLFAFIFFVFLLSSCGPAGSTAVDVPEPPYWPTTGWQTAEPETQGMDSVRLAEMVEDINTSQTNIHSVLVIRNGYLVTEAYVHPYTADTKEHIQSVTKSVIGMLTGQAILQGSIKSVDETLVSYFPGRVFANDGPDKQNIRLSHLLSMSSGLDCQEFSGGPSMEQTSGWVQFMLDLPVVSTPGKTFGYCNGNAHLLSAILQKSTGMTAREYANQNLFAPLGIPAVELADWPADPKGYSIGGFGLHLRPSDLAKLGFLMLHKGQWEDMILIDPAYISAAASQQVTKEDGSGYGYLWTVYPKAGHYAALGLGGQQIHVYPSKNLMVVVTAGLEAYAEAPEIEKLLNDYILPAVKSNKVLPHNPDGLARLEAAVEAAANPVQPVAELPAAALEISGSLYTFGENPAGWQTMELVFEQGSETAAVHFNGSPAIAVGLDNLYRLTRVQPFGEILLRGRWVDEQTFLVDYPYSMAGPTRLGELGDTDIQFKFTGDTLEVSFIPTLFGGDPIIFSGTR